MGEIAGMNAQSGAAFLENIADGLTALLGRVMDQLGGPWMQQRAIGPITWSDLGVMACFLTITLLFNGLVVGSLYHQKKKVGPSPEGVHWRRRFLDVVGKPIHLLILIFGIYLIATPLVPKLTQHQHVPPVRRALDAFVGLGMFVAVFWLFYRLTRVLEVWLLSLARWNQNKLFSLFVPLLGRSLRVMIPVVGVLFALPVLGLPSEYATVLGHASSILIICTVAWILFQAVNFGEKAVLASHDITVADNLHARRIYTQVHVFGTVLHVIIAIFTAGCILMLFAEVRHVGTSLLASAGVIGVIAGFAAQKTIANVFAGFQLALAQPIRIDDVVIVEGSFWGRIEEITFTFVVVHIWDDTRMILPLTYFIETPFQNWTRVSAQIMGQVHIYVDYSLPLDKVRPALKEIVEGSQLWDRRFWNLQVVEATEKTMQLRVLATAANSSKAWDLRCEIRENLLVYIQKEYPQSLPRFRAEMEHPADARGDGQSRFGNEALAGQNPLHEKVGTGGGGMIQAPAPAAGVPGA
jgi:small-conductance mechanosensitive channel